MEQFEKWWKEDYSEPRYIDNCLRYSASKAGWKAALKFALTVASAWRKCGIPTEIEDAINKELENDNPNPQQNRLANRYFVTRLRDILR